MRGNTRNTFLAALALWAGAHGLEPVRLYPAAGATGQCPDTPLRMEFAARPLPAWNGAVRIRDLDHGTLAKTWTMAGDPGDPRADNVASTWPWKDSVGDTRRNVWPIVIDSVPAPLAEVRLPPHLLRPLTRYQIEIDPGALKGADGSAFDGIAPGAWTFTTGPAPSPGAKVTVAEDNSGDVCSVQRGLELVPSKSATEVRVLVKPGYYREMIASAGKDNLRLYGAGADKTFIRYYNCENLNPGSALRGIVSLSGAGMHVRALSITSLVTVNGTQSEALKLDGDKCIVADVALRGHQDTWLNTGARAYVQDAVLQGSVDFIWGEGPTFFRRCALIATRSGGTVVQPRNAAAAHGYVFEGCTLSPKTPAITGFYLGRDAPAYPGGEAVFLNTTIYPGLLSPSAWLISGGADPGHTGFCEHGSLSPDGSPLAIADAQRALRQCPEEKASQLENPANALSGWVPSVPPLADILAQFPSALQRGPGGNAFVTGRPVRRGKSLRVAFPGAFTARVARPDGRTRRLSACAGPCTLILPMQAAGPAWVEIRGAGKAMILALPPGNAQ